MHLPRVPILVEAWWGAHDARGTASGRKTLNHPKNGVLQLMTKLVIYTPA